MPRGLWAAAIVTVCVFAIACEREHEKTTPAPSQREIGSDRQLCNDGGAGPLLKVGSLVATGGHARIAGTTSIGATIYINGVRTPVDSNGRFSALVARFAWNETVVVAFDRTGCTEWRFAANAMTVRGER